jgi:hypothetical protein
MPEESRKLVCLPASSFPSKKFVCLEFVPDIVASVGDIAENMIETSLSS